MRGEAAPNDLLGENIRVVLDFEQDDIRHMQSERGLFAQVKRSSIMSDKNIGIRRREVLKPLTYFPQRNPGRPQEIPEHPPLNPDSRACAFQDLHRKLTLNFRKSSGEFWRKDM